MVFNAMTLNTLRAGHGVLFVAGYSQVLHLPIERFHVHGGILSSVFASAKKLVDSKGI